MSIDKWLCENYDKSNKGYTTLSDISETIIWLSITFVITYGYFFGLYDCIFNGFRMTNTSSLTTANEIANFIFVIGSSILIIVGLFLLLVVISKIKITKCERRF